MPLFDLGSVSVFRVALGLSVLLGTGACAARSDGTEHSDSDLVAAAPASAGMVVATAWNGDAAREELIRVDPVTMTPTLIAPIPGVTGAAGSFADRRRGIIYVGATGDDGVGRLYAIEVASGHILSQPALPTFTRDPATGVAHGLAFEGAHTNLGFAVTADGTTVGLAWNLDLNRAELHRVDPATMALTLIAPIPEIRDEPSLEFADPADDIVYVSGGGADGVGRFYGLDTKTGHILTQPAFHDVVPVQMMADGSAVGLRFNGLQGYEIHKVDPKTMTHSLIAPLPDVVLTDQEFADPDSGIVYVVGGPSDSAPFRVYAVDAHTGSILSQPLWPSVPIDPKVGGHGFDFRGAGLQVFPRGH